MTRIVPSFVLRLAAAAALVAVPFAPAAAQDQLTTLNPTKSGKIVYGSLDGFTTEAGAMGAVLRSLHNQFSAKPEVGKPFQLKGSNSVALFFTVALKGQGDKKRAGMIIASKTQADRMGVAVVTDDEAQFSRTVNPMLGQLFKVWNPAPSAGDNVRRNGEVASNAAAGSIDRSAPPMPLRQLTLQDRSASVALPANWTVAQGSGGGSIMAEGPNGENAFFGFPFLAMNSNDPRVQQTMRFAQSPAGRNTSYATNIYYPYGGDATKMFIDMFQYTRRQHQLPPVGIEIASATKSQGGRCTHVFGKIDLRDNRGPREWNAIFCVGQLTQDGQYLSTATWTTLPVAVAARERATMGAMMQSFNMNMAVVSAQASAIAAPAIAQIHEIGRQAAERSAASDAWLKSSMSSFEEHNDAMGRQSQAFSNYMLDNAVIKDNVGGGHMTTWSSTADEIVKSNPTRFEYVPTPDFWKGIDY